MSAGAWRTEAGWRVELRSEGRTVSALDIPAGQGGALGEGVLDVRAGWTAAKNYCTA